MSQTYIPDKSIFTDLVVVYCPDCKENHYFLTAACCAAHKIEHCPYDSKTKVTEGSSS